MFQLSKIHFRLSASVVEQAKYRKEMVHDMSNLSAPYELEE